MEEYCVDVSKIMKKWENHEKLTKYEKMVLLSMLNEAKNIKYIIGDEQDMIETEERIKELSKDQKLIENYEIEIIKDYLNDN